MNRIQSAIKVPLYNYRFYVLMIMIGVVFLVLATRVFYLQVLLNDFLRQEGQSRFQRVHTISAHRGIITDRHGVELAVSVPVESVWVNPQEILEHQDAFKHREWVEFAALIDMKITDLKRWVVDRGDRRFAYLKRQLEPTVVSRIKRLKLPGIYLQAESRRYYPTGEVFANIVGFTDIDDHGQEGIERAYNDWLGGVSGSERVVKDRMGRIISKKGVMHEVNPGKDLVLSLDARIQSVAYQELKAAVKQHKARSGSIVMIDVATGEVLAMANQPSYNPNRREERKPSLTRNQAMTDTFEPGSTAKPFAVVAALETGKFHPDTIIETSPGYMRIGGSTVRDVHNYGRLDVTGVIKKSSNVGVSRMVLATPTELLLDVYRHLGFGVDSGSGFPGESSGDFRTNKRWSDFEKATLSYGYGFSVTPLQLAQAYAILASGGVHRPVSLVQLERAPQGERVLPDRSTRQVLKMMEEVITQGGTGTRASIAGYRVAGKTGTVRKATAGGYSNDYVSVFAGMAPASDPKLAVVVMINEPSGDHYYGGDVAAPVFGKVVAEALRIMNIAPDNMVPHPQWVAIRSQESGVRGQME